MIFHENRLLADDSHEIPYLLSNIRKDVAIFSSAAVVIGAEVLTYMYILGLRTGET